MTRLALAAPLLALAAVGCAPRPPLARPAAPASVVFRDVAAEAGLTYRWSIPPPRPCNILQTIGNGCAFLDADGDSHLDLLLVGSPPALYLGDGRGHFRDVSASWGLSRLSGHFLGCAVGDANEDGRLDVYLSAYRGGALLLNRGSGFQVSPSCGIASQPWGTSASFLDIDADGHLDLFVGNYFVFGPGVEPQLCEHGSLKTACGPRWYKPAFGRLYRGDGQGFFREVALAPGLLRMSGKVLGVAAADLEGKGRHPSLYIANDEMAADLLRPDRLQPLTLANIADRSGVAYDAEGKPHGGMGVDWGDYDNDGRLDLAVGTFQNELKSVYHNDGDGLFSERSATLGLEAATPMVSFGLRWFDADNDGWLDLLVANGHIQDNIEQIDPTTTYRQPTLFFRNRGGAGFDPVSLGASGRPIVGRGLSVGDYDEDGRLDAVVVDSEGAPLLLHNETPAVGHWLGLSLHRSGGRSPYGALVRVRAGASLWLRHCHGDGSYLSSSDARVHVGLGSVSRIDSVEVLWPGGSRSVLSNLQPDKSYVVQEGK